jgi:hypothetical protein
MVLMVSSVLSPVIGFLVTVIGVTRERHRQFDFSVEKSGPHGFAVRIDARRLRATQRPPHPALHVRDDRDTPLVR